MTCEPSVSTADLTLDQLVADMSDLAALAERPKFNFVAGMESSHNPVSVDPSDAATWHANADRGHYVRTNGDEHVLFEGDGPGVVTRIWSANPNGDLRIYVDGDLALEAPMKELLSGGVEPFSEPWAYTAALGSTFYFPIPFGRSCLITSTALDPLFFQVSFRKYPSDAVLEAFSIDEATAAICRHQDVLDALVSSPRTSAAVSALAEQSEASGTVAPGEDLTLDSPAFGDGTMIEALRVTIDSAEAIDLRSIWLTIAFDGRTTIQVPFVDFFGTGPESNDVASISTSVSPDGEFASTWPMPFEHGAVVSLRNGGETAISLHITMGSAPHTWKTNDRYFHATWHPPQLIHTEPQSDWAAARLRGEGVLVGTVLNVTNPSPAWWGEGDERIYIDGEIVPSFSGTGTEDFFGYAWCSTQLFSTAYVGQTSATPESNWGRISMYRLFVADPIPFQSSLDFDWEISHWRTGQDAVDVYYDAVFYWYAPLDSEDVGAQDIPDDMTLLTPPLTTERPPPNHPELAYSRCR